MTQGYFDQLRKREEQHIARRKSYKKAIRSLKQFRKEQHYVNKACGLPKSYGLTLLNSNIAQYKLLVDLETVEIERLDREISQVK